MTIRCASATASWRTARSIPEHLTGSAEFHEVFEPEQGGGGFDVVIGNPPYIRQEWLSPIKPYLQSRYAAYHGMADLYVYFYELGLSLLRPGGRLSYVVTNKWMKAGYGEPLRRLLAEKGWVESVVDFGHAKQIFEDADVFPSIVVIRRPQDRVSPPKVRVCAIPREQLRIEDLSVQIDKEGVEVAQERLSPEGWSLESESANTLLEKIRGGGVPLSDYLGAKPLMGIKTGLNEAFLIDTATRDQIVALDPGSGDVIRPYLRGQDIRRWSPVWAGLWMIALKSSGDYAWPWANAGQDAEVIFARSYPGLYAAHEALGGRTAKAAGSGPLLVGASGVRLLEGAVQAPNCLPGHHVVGQLLPDIIGLPRE